jgi:hypothetical protein
MTDDNNPTQSDVVADVDDALVRYRASRDGHKKPTFPPNRVIKEGREPTT